MLLDPVFDGVLYVWENECKELFIKLNFYEENNRKSYKGFYWREPGKK